MKGMMKRFAALAVLVLVLAALCGTGNAETFATRFTDLEGYTRTAVMWTATAADRALVAAALLNDAPAGFRSLVGTPVSVRIARATMNDNKTGFLYLDYYTADGKFYEITFYPVGTPVDAYPHAFTNTAGILPMAVNTSPNYSVTASEFLAADLIVRNGLPTPTPRPATPTPAPVTPGPATTPPVGPTPGPGGEEFHAEGSCGEYVNWTLDTGLLRIYGTGRMNDYTSWTSVPWYGMTVTGVVVESGVTNIGQYAFYSNKELVAVSLPDSVTEIGSRAFYSCEALVTINLTDSLTRIGEYAFCFCGLMQAELPASVTVIGKNAFNYCKSLRAVRLSPTLTEIPEGAFANCEALTEVVLPEGVTRIADKAFYSCSSLSSINIPAGLTSVGKNGFAFCTSLRFAVPATVTQIGEGAFQYCREMTSVSLWPGLTSIPKSAFSNCESLTEITLPDGVVDIGERAFYSCEDVRTIRFSRELTTVGSSAFAFCTSLTSIVLPSGVTTIGDKGFYYCSSLSRVTMPAGTAVGTDAFTRCSGALAFTYASVTPEPTSTPTPEPTAEPTPTPTPEPTAEPEPEPLTVSIPEGTIVINVGDTYVLHPLITPAEAASAAVYESLDPGIAWVSSTGTIYGAGKGRTGVMVTVMNSVATVCEVVVLGDRVAVLPADTVRVEAEAFADLSSVDVVRLTGAVTYIADDAFAGSDVVIAAPAGSYAESWAREHRVGFVAE